MKLFDEHSGFSMSWTFYNSQCLLRLGLEEFKNKWINSRPQVDIL